jgi:glucosylceramidase
VAPVIVDPEKDEVYLTPIYYTLSHFSRFIRPGAKIIDLETQDKDLMITAAENPDGTIAVIVFNDQDAAKNISLKLDKSTASIKIDGKAIQTIVINNPKQ